MNFDNLILWLNERALSVYPISFDLLFSMRNSIREIIQNSFSWSSEWSKSEVKRKNRDLCNVKRKTCSKSSANCRLRAQILDYRLKFTGKRDANEQTYYCKRKTCGFWFQQHLHKNFSEILGFACIKCYAVVFWLSLTNDM